MARKSKIERKARELAIADGVDPDGVIFFGRDECADFEYDDSELETPVTTIGALAWRGYVKRARQELAA